MKLWESYCSQVVFREVFSCVFCTKIPSFTARNGAFCRGVNNNRIRVQPFLPENGCKDRIGANRMNTEFQSEQMAEMARLYYMEGRNQTEIEERPGRVQLRRPCHP